MMEATEDGFKIAEKDLELRGGGEVLGARQSGMPEFRVAEVPNFAELLTAARDDARLILGQDPQLATPARPGAARAALPVRMRRSRAPVPRRVIASPLVVPSLVSSRRPLSPSGRGREAMTYGAANLSSLASLP